MFNKKYFCFIVITVGLVILFPQASFGAEQFSRDLYFGLQQDLDITKLQEFLSDEGLYSGPITGNFFSLTLKAVKAFQAREGITPVAGYFGPKTRMRANELLSVQIQSLNQQAIDKTGQTVVQYQSLGTDNNSISNLQLQIDALLKQITALQQQFQIQQQNQINISNLTSNQITTTTLDAFVPNISIDKEEIKNDGADFAVIQVITKLTSGMVLENKSLKIKTSIYKDGVILEPFEESRLSDSQGMITFKTRPTSYYDRCGWMKISVNIIDNESGRILYSRDIKIINVQSLVPGGGMCP